MNAANPSKQTFQYKPRTLEQWMLRAYGQAWWHGNRGHRPASWTQSASLAAEWHCIRFEWFISVIPSKPISTAYLRQLFNSFEEELRKALTVRERRHFISGALGYVVCFEPTPIPHFHVCLISNPKLEKERIKTILRKLFGTNPDSVDVRKYDLNKDGVGYALKSLDDESGDYDISNLKPFLPNSHSKWLARKEREMSPFRRAFMKRFRGSDGVSANTGQKRP